MKSNTKKIQNEKKKHKRSFYIIGLVTGALNGLFGSGGGMLSVPLLEKSGIEPKKSHASSIAITLPLSIVSAAMYLYKGNIDFMFAIKFVPFGLLGAIIGSTILKKMKNETIEKIFAFVLIFSGIRMLFL